MPKQPLKWWELGDDAARLVFLRGALEEIAYSRVPADDRAEPMSSGAVTDELLIAGARIRFRAMDEERRMLRRAVLELECCTWTWGSAPAGDDGTLPSWDLIEKAREAVATAHKYRVGEAERPEVAALRRELADLRAAHEALTAERDTLAEAVRWATSAEDDQHAGPAVGAPALAGRLRARIGRLLEGHERALNSLLTVAFGVKRAKAGEKVPPHEEGRLHALRDMDASDELARHALADVAALTEQLDAAGAALSRAYLFARAGASLNAQGSGLGDGVDRMTGEQAFQVAWTALRSIVAETRAWRAGR